MDILRILEIMKNNIYIQLLRGHENWMAGE